MITAISVKRIHLSLNKELVEKLNSLFNNDFRIKNKQETINVSKILYENFENTEYILNQNGREHNVKIKNIVEYNNGTFSINIEDYSFFSKHKNRSLSVQDLQYFKRKPLSNTNFFYFITF